MSKDKIGFYKLYAIPPEGEAFIVFDHIDNHDIVWNNLETQPFPYLDAPNKREEHIHGSRSVTRYWGDHPKLRGLENHKFELRRWLDKNWRRRERGRFEDGDEETQHTYRSLPDAWDKLALNEDHFVHISAHNEPGKTDYIAFTENEDKGMRDVQTRMRAGKYVKKFFPHLNNEAVRFYASAVQALNDVQMTDDPELAAKIYENGPRSCMSKCFKWNKYNTHWHDDPPRHPVAVYFAGDLKLAWMGDPSHASARCLVWPEKKLYGRIYGAYETMRQALEGSGYTCCYGRGGKSTFFGAKLRYIRRNDHEIVMPYLDSMALEYSYEDDALYAGGVTGRKKNVPEGSESGIIQFTDPKMRSCAITRTRMKDSDDIVMLDTGEEGLRKHAVSHGYVESIEGWTNAPVYLCSEDTEEVHSNRVWSRPSRAFVHDILERGRTVYRPRKDCIEVVGGYTRKGNAHKLVKYDTRYYRDLQQLFQYHPSLNPCPDMLRDGPIPPSLWKHIKYLSDRWLEPNDYQNRYGKTLEECHHKNNSHFHTLIQHFMHEVKQREQEERKNHTAAYRSVA